MSSRLITIPIKNEIEITLSLSLSEKIITEKISDALYYKLSRKLKKYKKGFLVLRTRSRKEYSIERDEQVFYYALSWGIKKESKNE